MKITGKQLENDIKQAISDVSSETLFEINNLLGLYDITSFDHVQDLFTVNDEFENHDDV